MTNETDLVAAENETSSRHGTPSVGSGPPECPGLLPVWLVFSIGVLIIIILIVVVVYLCIKHKKIGNMDLSEQHQSIRFSEINDPSRSGEQDAAHFSVAAVREPQKEPEDGVSSFLNVYHSARSFESDAVAQQQQQQQDSRCIQCGSMLLDGKDDLSCDVSCTSEDSTDSDSKSAAVRFVEKTNWEIPQSQLSMMETLGQGHFGKVVRAAFRSVNTNDLSKDVVTEVAVKFLTGNTEKEERNFRNEIEIMKRIGKNRHVVSLMGCCGTRRTVADGSGSSTDGPLYYVMELMERGSLETFLRTFKKVSAPRAGPESGKPSGVFLTKRSLNDYAIQIARGMHYLEKKKIIHRDLAARNILVGKDYFTVKIADFGLARHSKHSTYHDSDGEDLTFPFKWLAPECLARFEFSTSSDVWAFGVLLWEIQTLGRAPYDQFSDSKQMLDYLREGNRLQQPFVTSRRVYLVMRQCWEFLPDNRTDFRDLIHNLTRIRRMGEY